MRFKAKRLGKKGNGREGERGGRGEEGKYYMQSLGLDLIGVMVLDEEQGTGLQ